MQKISDFLSPYRNAIIWTVWYIAFMWAILYFLFNFCMFSAADWTRLIHAHLRGFPGFVFGLLLLAAGPLYVATTTLIMRTGKPLMNLPVPKMPKISNIFKKNKPESQEAVTEPEPSAPPAPQTIVEPLDNKSIELPNGAPNEMRGAFLRARRNIAITGIKPIAPHSPSPTRSVPETENTLPLPMDFDMPDDFITTDDLDATDNFSSIPTEAPVFKEISFDDAPSVTDAPSSTGITELIEQLSVRSCNAIADGDIIITDKFAIAMHDDPDFWIADEEIWFAAGKSKPSPIIMATDAAARHNRTPALYLGKKNIMDLDGHIEQWTANGIHIANTPGELV